MKFTVKSPSDKQSIISYITNLSESKAYFVEIKQIQKRRTIDQNRLYWLWLKCLQDETGQDRDILHEYFKQKFLGSTVITLFNEKVQIPNTTTKMDTELFKRFLDRVQIFASMELGIELPLPEDLHWEQFYNQYKNYI